MVPMTCHLFQIAHRTYALAVRMITSPDEVKVDVLAPVDRVTDPPNLLPLPPDKLTRPPSEDADRPAPPTTFTGPAACARGCAWIRGARLTNQLCLGRTRHAAGATCAPQRQFLARTELTPVVEPPRSRNGAPEPPAVAPTTCNPSAPRPLQIQWEAPRNPTQSWTVMWTVDIDQLQPITGDSWLKCAHIHSSSTSTYHADGTCRG